MASDGSISAIFAHSRRGGTALRFFTGTGTALKFEDCATEAALVLHKPLIIGFLTTHPIQYQVPVFRLLAEEPGIELTVLFAMLPDQSQQGAGFGVEFEWDVPLLDGYRYEVLDNVAATPSVTSFSGCDTPDVGEVMRRLRLDVLIVNGWVVKSCLQGLWAARRLGVPCLVRGEANNLRPRVWWKRLVHRRLLNQYAGFLCIGERNREFYRGHGIAESKLFRAPYCIENDRFHRQFARRVTRREVLRDQWGVPRGATCFLFCGKLESKKHPLELLDAFREAIEQGSGPVHLLVVGDGELRTVCERAANRMKLPVSFTGFMNQSEIIDAYVVSDCLVLPSDHGETWGLVVNEAMACGLPAIVSDQVGCAVDLIQPGGTGDVFAFGDWSDLAQQMIRYADRDRLTQMGTAASKMIQAYSPQVAAQGIVDAVKFGVSSRHGRRDHGDSLEVERALEPVD